MELSNTVIPKECYPRLAYASRNIPTLERRFREIKERIGILSSDVYSKNLNRAFVHCIKKISEADSLFPEEIVLKTPEKIKSTKVVRYKTLKTLLEKNKTSESDISIVITSSKMKDKLYKLDRCGHYIVHVASDLKEAKELTKEFSLTGQDIVFSTKEKLANDMNNLLERIALQPLKSAYEILQNLLHTEQPESKPARKKRRRDFDYHPYAKLSSSDKELIECLCEEILALDEMSNVPELNRPEDFSDMQVLITKEIRDDIFSQCPTVKAVGYHFNNLHIYVEEEKKSKEIVRRDAKITAVMHKHNVRDYCITNISGQFIELMDVGSTIEARAHASLKRSGSLGCYADVIDSQASKASILLSRHVVDGCNEIYVVEDEEKKMITTVMQETTEHEDGLLDIAAAEVKDNVRVEKDARKLKDSEGKRREGMLCENSGSGKILRNGRKVHIWGAKSRPGYGIVTDIKYSIDGMQASLIQIQDYFGDGGKPFAREGDSGSIVCSDDPDDEHVNALAMLIGQGDVNHACKLGKKRTYISLPLREGIEQLERKTRKIFRLF